MKSMRAWRGLLVGSLVVMGLGCGDDPLPMTGSAYWREGCPASTTGTNCNANSHSVRGSAGSPTVDITCSVAPTTGGNIVTFRIAAVGAGQGFAESNEGIFATGFLSAPGTELRAGDDGGYVQLRGAGWGVRPEAGTIGPAGACHVFVDRLNGQNFNGRLKCDNVLDDLSPPRMRYVVGLVPQTMTNDYAEFTFSNCDTR